MYIQRVQREKGERRGVLSSLGIANQMSPRITLYIEAAHPQKLLFWCGKYKTSEKTQRDVSISKKDLSLLLLFGIIYPICRELLQFFFFFNLATMEENNIKKIPNRSCLCITWVVSLGMSFVLSQSLYKTFFFFGLGEEDTPRWLRLQGRQECQPEAVLFSTTTFLFS